VKQQVRSLRQRIVDVVFFPVRALFIPEESAFGLTSLRDERFEIVAKHIKGKVLDVGCGKGNLFVKNWCKHPESTGIDVYAYDGVKHVHQEMTNLPFENNSFDTVTLIAVGGHIPKYVREKEFLEFSRVLKPNGMLLMTEGEAITQTVGHIWRHFSYSLIGKKDMDSERGMDEDEQYCMPYDEIMQYLNTPPLQFARKFRFMWGLNNCYLAVKDSQ